MNSIEAKRPQFSVRRLFIVMTAVAVSAALFRRALGTEFLWVQITLISLIGLIAALATKNDFRQRKFVSPQWAYYGGLIAGMGLAVVIAGGLPDHWAANVLTFASLVGPLLILIGGYVAERGQSPTATDVPPSEPEA